MAEVESKIKAYQIQRASEGLDYSIDTIREYVKGVFCSVAVPVADQPIDHINAHPAKAADERIHPRRGDKVFKWVEN